MLMREVWFEGKVSHHVLSSIIKFQFGAWESLVRITLLISLELRRFLFPSWKLEEVLGIENTVAVLIP